MARQQTGQFHSLSAPARWMMACALVAASLLYATWIGRLAGIDSFWFAFNLHFVAMATAHMLMQLLRPKLTARCFDVKPLEPAIYRRIGVICFMHLLRRIGWTAATRNSLVFDGTRGSLHTYERATRESEFAHAWIFIGVGALVIVAAIDGAWPAVFWLGSMNVLFHLYPVMLQRTQRPRLQAMMARRPVTPDQVFEIVGRASSGQNPP